MDLDTVFAALQQADKQAQADSPYKGFSDLATSVGQSLIQGAPKYSLGEDAIGGLLTGLLGGFSDSLTDDYRTKQNDLAQTLFQNVVAGQPVTRPSGMSPSVFSSINNASSLFKLQQIMDQEAEKRKANLQVQTALQEQAGLLPTDLLKMSFANKLDIDKLVQANNIASVGLPDEVRRLPKALQDDYMKAQAQNQKNQSLVEFVKNQFAEADQVNPLAALDPTGITADSKKLSGIQNSILEAYQNAARTGEINDAVREQMKTLVPQATDTAGTRADKLKRLEDLLGTGGKTKPMAFGTTPNAGAATLAPVDAATGANSTTGVPAGATPTGRTYQGKPVYNVNGKLWVPD